MSNTELLINEYRENKRLIEELTALNEELKNKIIDAMEGKDSAVFGSAKVSNKEIVSSRFNSTGFKKKYPALYEEYTTQTSYKRFTVA